MRWCNETGIDLVETELTSSIDLLLLLVACVHVFGGPTNRNGALIKASTSREAREW